MKRLKYCLKYATMVGLAASLLVYGNGITSIASNSPFEGVNTTNSSDVVTTATIIDTPIYMSPPSDFNPLTATADELKQYGLPPKPTDTTKLASWETLVTHAKHYVAPEQTALDSNYPTNGLVRKVLSTNWAGYMVRKQENSGATYAQSICEMSVPQYNGSYCPSYWTGIGGYNVDYITQAGFWTNANHNGGVNHSEFWIEDYPHGTVLEAQPYIASSNTVLIQLTALSGEEATAILENETRDTYTVIEFNDNYQDNTSVEYICEACNSKQDYFNDNYFDECQYEQLSGDYNTLYNSKYIEFYMTYEKPSVVYSNNLFNMYSYYS